MGVRLLKSTDEPQLILLWQEAFGDDTDFICDFLHNIARRQQSIVWDEYGKICSAAYLIDGITVCGRPVPYIYAVATLPEYRGRGFGAAVCDACIEIAKPNSCALSPADERLSAWYEKIGFIPSYNLYEAKMQPEYRDFELTELDAKSYAALRRRLLKNTNYADFRAGLLKWWQRCWNGRFYSFDGGCVSICRQDEGFLIPELLAYKNGMAALGRLCGGFSVCVRTPVLDKFEVFGEKKPFLSAAPADTGVFWSFTFE